MNVDFTNEWVALAPAWIREVREGRNANRAGLLDPAMLEACGDVAGLRVLDCGCGEGRFCRLLVERGASHVLGVDLCEPLIEAAKELHSERDWYRVGDVQNMPFINGQTFGLAVSYLNQCDLPDFEANNREVFRVLKPGAKFVVANVHPMRSAVGGWHTTEDGQKAHVILDRYLDESERHWRMMGCEFTNFHRTLSTYHDGFREAGFVLERIIEPFPTPEALAQYPELEHELRVPNFIIYALRKP